MSLGSILAIWEVLGIVGTYDVTLLPRPSSVITALTRLAIEGLLWKDLTATSLRIFVGFVAGSSTGFAIGLLTGLVPSVRHFVEPLVQVARPIPAVALIPLAVTWFGVGELAKFFIVAWASFFPVWVNTHLGVQRVPQELTWTATILGASRRRMIVEVVVPWSLPFIQAGIRVALGLAFAATVVAEMSGASAGLGFRIFTSQLVYRNDLMLGAILIVGALGALIDWIFTRGTRAVLPWLDKSSDKQNKS